MGIYRTQSSFTGGEISPRMYGRIDIASYRNSCVQMENFVVLPQGPLTSRPGTRYRWTVKDSTKDVRLLPFEVSQSASYTIEMGPLYFRFGKYGTRQTVGTLAAWDSGTAYVKGDQVSKAGTNYYAIADSTNKDPATETAYWYAMTGSIFEIPHPYTEAQLPDVRYCQNIDVMWMFHAEHPVYRLERYGDTDWLFVPEGFLDGPYLATNSTATTLTPSGASGSVTVTASATTGINDGQGFLATDVGRLLRINNNDVWAWGEITARTSDKIVTVLVVGSTFPTSATADWRLGRYSDTTGYPSIGALHEARLVMCDGEIVDASRTSIPSDFGVSDDVVASDACNFSLYASEANPVNWLVTTRNGLAIGTMSGEWLMTGGSSDEAMSPVSINAKKHSSVGAYGQQPIQCDNATLFVARTRDRVHEFAYVYEDNGYRAPDLTILSDHIFRQYGIRYADIWRSKQIVWFVRDDGTLAGLTYRRAEQVLAWHTHTTDGTFLDVACVNEGDVDTPYFIVKRTINGSDVKYIESLDRDWVSGDFADAYVVDCGIKYDSTATTTISGLGHLEGETVIVLADGMVVSGKVVSSGAITLDNAASKVMVGLPYNSHFESLPIEEIGLGDGSSMGRVKNANRVSLKFVESYGGWVGYTANDVNEIIFNESLVYGAAPVPYTGDKEIALNGGYGTDKRVHVTRTAPFPMTISAITVEWDSTQRGL